MIFIIILVNGIFSSCDRPNKTIVEDVAQINSDCPISAGKLGNIYSVSIKDGCVVIQYILDDEFKKIAWKNPKAVFDERMQYLDIAMLDTTEMENQPLVKLYYDAFNNGYSIKNEYHNTVQDGADVILSSTLLTPNVYFGKYLKGNLKQLCEEGLKTRSTLENLLYNSLDLPDSLQSFDVVEDSSFVLGCCVSKRDYINIWFDTFSIKKNLAKSFKDPSMRSFAKQCAICDKCISFRYICKSENDSVCVDFTPNELNSLVNKYDEYMQELEEIESL